MGFILTRWTFHTSISNTLNPNIPTRTLCNHTPLVITDLLHQSISWFAAVSEMVHAAAPQQTTNRREMFVGWMRRLFERE